MRVDFFFFLGVFVIFLGYVVLHRLYDVHV
jgi:hypothetical protein